MPIRQIFKQGDNSADFLNKIVHVICPATNGLTVFNAYVCALGGMPSEEATEHVNRVNVKNETGTLFPRFNMTIIPLSSYEGRDDFNDEEIMKKYIADCFEAELKYIKSNRILFIFEQAGGFDNVLAAKVLLKYWSDTEIDVEYFAV